MNFVFLQFQTFFSSIGTMDLEFKMTNDKLNAVWDIFEGYQTTFYSSQSHGEVRWSWACRKPVSPPSLLPSTSALESQDAGQMQEETPLLSDALMAFAYYSMLSRTGGEYGSNTLQRFQILIRLLVFISTCLFGPWNLLEISRIWMID